MHILYTIVNHHIFGLTIGVYACAMIRRLAGCYSYSSIAGCPCTSSSAYPSTSSYHD